jgi:hypothetical protein
MEKKSSVDEADPPESGETKGDEISTENSYHQVVVRNGIFEVPDFPPSSFFLPQLPDRFLPGTHSSDLWVGLIFVDMAPSCKIFNPIMISQFSQFCAKQHFRWALHDQESFSHL